MIKIVKPGNLEYSKICKYCGCEFTYNLKDDVDRGVVRCPTCGYEINHITQYKHFTYNDVDPYFSQGGICTKLHRYCLQANCDGTCSRFRCVYEN